jgi:2'-5' RNA ligase
LEPAVRTELADLRSSLEPTLVGWRWVDVENLHLTVRFLGEVEGARDRTARVAWRRAAARVSAGRARLGGLRVWPNPSRPRVLVIGIEQEQPPGSLAKLSEHLEQEAREQGFAPERRAFRPHLTLARARREPRPSPPSLSWSRPKPVRLRALGLYRSILGSAGARYTLLEEYPLKCGSTDPPAEPQESNR